ncbi:DUF1987 domain-containing protein [Williamwhitmania taraxaci]|uniref:SiaC family regulatory phosphoprotein domain-containing protein n=1 Tax=Williamwhitmania taraxaci TaxID=1640674 RepID=A0A1G6MP75_9BACT|nr:DUF1987 domain-containing protein [Williamwhitmania taraxaci]SDC57034.1 protein of unknown function [Williamwhitmania taraxaci]
MAEVIFFRPKLEDRPGINFNGETGLLEIEGRSLPEDSVVYYQPAIAWLKEYALNPRPITTLDINIYYMNSASAKRIVDILEVLDGIKQQGFKVDVVWKYRDDDDDCLDEGYEMARMCSIPFNYRPI